MTPFHFLGQPYNLRLRRDYYLNGNLAVLAYDDEEDLFADITRNIWRLPDNCACVDTNNLSGICEWLEENQIAKPTDSHFSSGYCVYPVYEFDLSQIPLLDIEPLVHDEWCDLSDFDARLSALFKDTRIGSNVWESDNPLIVEMRAVYERACAREKWEASAEDFSRLVWSF